MGLALVVIIAVAFGVGYVCGRRAGAARGLEMLGSAELRNRKRITGLDD